MNSLRTRVKMCGMTRTEDIHHAINLGVDAVGVIFHPKSTRYVELGHASELLKNIPAFVDVVAVLVNPEVQFVNTIIKELPLQLLQFHGDESPDFCQQFNFPFIKAIHPNTMQDIQNALVTFKQASGLLLDSASHTLRGGTGVKFDWSIIPKQESMPFILAGGLSEHNVSEAVNLVTPYAVDVCSGIEAVPGIKDHQKMSQFIKAIGG